MIYNLEYELKLILFRIARTIPIEPDLRILTPDQFPKNAPI